MGNLIVISYLTRYLREPGGPCTKSMEVSEYRMEWVKKNQIKTLLYLFIKYL